MTISQKNALYQKTAQDNCAARLAAVSPLVLMSVYFYGWRALVLTAVAAATAVLCDIFSAALRRRRWDYEDLSSILFAVLLVGMMPATVSYSTVVLSTCTAVLVGKQLFGGFGSYPFHPTALGYVVAVISWPQQLLSFPAPFTRLGLENIVKFTPVDSPAQIIKMEGLPHITRIYRIMGVFSGPMAVNATVVVAACGLLLVAVGRFHPLPALGYLAGCAAVSWLLPRVADVDRVELLTDEMLCCGLVFCAVFLVQDEICGAHTGLGRLLYGVAAGLATMMFQYYGSYPYGCCFGVLCADAVSIYLDDCVALLRKKCRDRAGIWTTPTQKETV